MSVLVAKQAPDFCEHAVLPDGTMKDDFRLSDLRGKYVVLFFWSLDYTFVCPTEILAHDHRIEEFKKRGVEVIGVSIDSHFTHHAWRSTPVEKGGIGPIRFTMVADVKHQIAQAYGIEWGGDWHIPDLPHFQRPGWKPGGGPAHAWPPMIKDWP